MMLNIGERPTRDYFNSFLRIPAGTEHIPRSEDRLDLGLDSYQKRYSWEYKKTKNKVLRTITHLLSRLKKTKRVAHNHSTRRSVRGDLWRLLTAHKRDNGYGIARDRARQLLGRFDAQQRKRVSRRDHRSGAAIDHRYSRGDLLSLKRQADVEAVSTYGRILRKIQDWKDQWNTWRIGNGSRI